MQKVWLFIVAVVVIFTSCDKEAVNTPANHNGVQHGNWLVPFEDILYWGDPLDEILAIDDPVFETVSQSNWKADDRMLIHHHEGITRVYPIRILQEHEIINDRINDQYHAISYCPLTGSGLSWNRTLNDNATTFGVSGMLFRDNLIPYDRNTGSYWSQMLSLCIHGELIGTEPEAIFLFETDFGLVSSFFPEAEILADPFPGPVPSSTSSYNFKSINDEIEPGTSSDPVLEPGRYYYGIPYNDRVLIFPEELFTGGTKAYESAAGGKSIIVLGNNELNFIIAFSRSGTSGKNFQAIQNLFPVVVNDHKGNEYNVFGKVESGPDEGFFLDPAGGYKAKGFAWESLFSRVEIFSP